MKILLLGAHGQVGYELQGPLSCFAEVVALGRQDLDLSQPALLREALAQQRPDCVLNAAAYTAVDAAEEDETTAQAVNRDAVAEMGRYCREQRAGLVHISTDFVFDGRSDRPYVESDPTAPLNAYGRSKRAGEEALAQLDAPALTFRTAWVYSLRRPSFIKTMLRLAGQHERLKVVDDQHGSPTFCRDLAQALAALCFAARSDVHGFCQNHRGIYHLAGEGACSRYELVSAMLELCPTPLRTNELEACSSDTFPLPAARPSYSVLNSGLGTQTFGLKLPPWRDGLRRALGDRFSAD